MRQIWRKVDPRTRAGEIKLECSDSEDMWHLYNLLMVDDTVRATTFRKIQKESDTGTSVSTQKKLTLTLRVTKISYDNADAAMRVTGKNMSENDSVKIGAYHTLEIEPHRAFTIGKECWDSMHMQRLTEALNPHTDADLAAVMMHEGLAHVLLVNRSLTLTRARIERTIPRKGKNALYNRGTSMEKFFGDVLNALLAHIRLDSIKVLLIASPGYVKDEFFKYLNLQAERTDNKVLKDTKQKIVLCHASNGHRHSFQEVVSRPEIMNRLEKTKAISEVQTLQNFFKMLADDETRAVYGPIHVLYAQSMGAIETLLVTDGLFRSADIETRKKFVRMVEDAKRGGAKVSIFSDQHVSGNQLKEMSGVAAILRFPIHDINEAVAPQLEAQEDSDSSDSSDDDDSREEKEDGLGIQ